MQLFQMTNYRNVILENIEKNNDQKGYKGKLAEAAKCNKSYFSQILNGSVDLNLDHALGLARFWKFNSEETEYFLNLVEKERSGSHELKEYMEEKLKRMREKKSSLSSSWQSVPQLELERQKTYYSEWPLPAIHVATSVPEYQTVAALAKRFNLSKEKIESSLEKLKTFGLVDQENNRWKIKSWDLHLDPESPYYQINHTNWRQRTITQLQEKDRLSGLHYTGLHTLSKKDADKLKFKIQDFLSGLRPMISQSKEEEVYYFLCDFDQL